MAATAQDFSSHFGLANIPFGIASSQIHSQPQAVSRHGSTVIFLADIVDSIDQLSDLPKNVFSKPTLNAFASLGRPAHQAVRNALHILIKDGELPLNSIEDIKDVKLHLPISVGDFTDFSCSEYHNLNAGHAVTGRRGLPPTWGLIPPGYAGRSSSIVISGTPVRRPRGHFWADAPAAMRGENKKVVCGPCKMMDYELELGAVIGKPVSCGEGVSATDAGDYIFGFVILNDWSARDIQTFEMVPLGPLNSKNSATTMSPWIITYDALEKFRTEGKSNFQVAPHLIHAKDRALSINLEINVTTSSAGEQTTCRCNSAVMAWSFEQLIAHQSSAGCGLRSGDLLGIGTVSEEGYGKRGCLLEDNIPALGTSRGFLNDGDIVQFTGYCGEGVGFGECKAQLLPAIGGEAWTTT